MTILTGMVIWRGSFKVGLPAAVFTRQEVGEQGMSLKTTTIGSFPKPDYVPFRDWYCARDVSRQNPTKTYDDFLRSGAADVQAVLARATQEVVRDQVAAGIDIPTDGEVPREHYIYYHCRHIPGFDFENLTAKTMRGGSWQAQVPTVTEAVSAGDPFLAQDWRRAQAATANPVKITVPGPMTIMDSTADAHYGDPAQLVAALAAALNTEIRRLADAGCEWIQVDEPVFARYPDRALDYGVDALGRCFHGVPAATKRAVHICCGYPAELDMEGYPKADQSAYFDLADALELAPVDAVSIEDAHCHNDLTLLERFRTTSIMFGVVNISQSRIESIDEIRARLEAALQHIDQDRLIAAPDCGLTMLSRELALDKLRNLSTAAKLVGRS